MRVLVLEHVAAEPAAAYGDALEEHGVELTVAAFDRGDAVPDESGFDGIVVMGGPMSANDDVLLSWLAAEKRLIARAVLSGKAFLGICLGAQLLAKALGAEVRAGPAPEVGVAPVWLTPDGVDDPVLGRLPAELPAMHWHSDTFDLPHGAVLLASSEAYENQAFRIGPRAYGIQFHLEAPAPVAASWGDLPDATMDELATVEPQMLAHARVVAEGWIERCLRAPLAPSGKSATRK